MLIATNASLQSERIMLQDCEQLEYVCVKITAGSHKIFLFAVYIRSVHEVEKFMLFSEAVKKIQYDENDSVIVCGDFNQPGIKWVQADDGEYFLPTSVTTEGAIAVCDTMLDSGMHQMCNITNQAGNVLDLVFTNRFYEMSLHESSRPLLPLDVWHKAIEVNLNIEEERQTEPDQSVEVYAYHLANFDAMSAFFDESAELSNIAEVNSIDDSFNILYSVLHV